MSKEKISHLQQLWADYFVQSGNGTDAARRAGYKGNDKTLTVIAVRNSRNHKIQKYIKENYSENMEKAEQQRIADADEVLKYLTAVMRGESSACEVVVEGQEVGVSKARLVIKPPDEKERLKAAELLGKRYCLFKEVQTEAEYENPFKDLSEEDLLKLTKVSDEDD